MNPITLKKSFSVIADEGSVDPEVSKDLSLRLRDHIDSLTMAKFVINGMATNTPSLPEDSSNFDSEKLLRIMEDLKQPVVAGITVKSQVLLDEIKRQTKPKPGEHEFMGFKFFVKEGQKEDCLIFYDAKLLNAYLDCDLIMAELRAKMEQEDDIKRVVRLERAGDRFRYLIETPFKTFPKFVIGTTDAEFDVVRLELRCGLLESAEAAWDRIVKGLPIED